MARKDKETLWAEQPAVRSLASNTQDTLMTSSQAPTHEGAGAEHHSPELDGTIKDL